MSGRLDGPAPALTRRTLFKAFGALSLGTAFGPTLFYDAAHAKAWAPRPVTYRVHKETEVPITMSDGTVLRADVYRPALDDGSPAPGRFPVLMTQTPYKKSSSDSLATGPLPYLVRRGYVDVVVDVRGTGTSEGIFDQTFSAAQTRDGKELVEWAASREWSTGRVGLHGSSYQGINQLLTAAQQPQGLAATFPIVPNGDAYRTNFPGGYLSSLVAFALLYPANGVEVPGYAAEDPLAAMRTLGSRPAGILASGAHVAGLVAGDDKTYDGPAYWSISPLAQIDRIKAPTFLVGGWSDALSQRDGGLLFRELQRRGVPVKLVMGPWTHTDPGTGLAAHGLPTLEELHLRWFDRHVAGRSDPSLSTWGPAFLFRTRDGYRRSDTWTVEGLTYRQAFLGDGSLTLDPPEDSSPDQIAWQPANGVCSGSSYVGTFGIGPRTPCTDDNRVNDLASLTYDMPLAEDLLLTGPIAARLFVATNGRDAHVVLRVEDVAPTGEVRELTTGWDTLSFRALDLARSDVVNGLVVRPHHPYTEESVLPVEPDKVYEWWVEIRPTSVRIPRGHTLRLAVQTADTVRYLPTASAVPELAGSVMSIHHDHRYPSALVLPTESEGARPGSGRS